MILAGRALALVRGREYALPQDLHELAHDVLRHRLVLSYEALADDVTADDIIDRILATVPVPELVLRERIVPRRSLTPSDAMSEPAAPSAHRHPSGCCTASNGT